MKGTETLNWLKQQEDDGVLNLRYFDESGVSLTPVVPYGWQPIGETCRIPCRRSQRFNILGFMGRKNEYFFQTSDKSVNTETVIEAFDKFAEDYACSAFNHTEKLCVVVLDNASMHRSKAFLDKVDDWLLKGVILHFIPPYSPALNLIEILWRKIKYEWLPLSAYPSFSVLKESVNDVLERLGKELLITFA